MVPKWQESFVNFSRPLSIVLVKLPRINLALIYVLESFVAVTLQQYPWSSDTVKPVCNDHIYNKINYLWFIQWCILMQNEGTSLLLLTISASGAYLGGPWPPRWAPEGREVSY